jgi:hypothetical protein
MQMPVQPNGIEGTLAFCSVPVTDMRGGEIRSISSVFATSYFIRDRITRKKFED